MVAKKILCIVGTRPEVIKMASVIAALRLEAAFSVSVLCSGQHRELLAPLIEWFDIKVDDDLDIMTEDQSLGELTARLMRAFDDYLGLHRPDLVLAQGDTTTVMSAALSCYYRGIAFGHVEAGLRTFDVYNPFPEEFNRVAVSRVARLHFCPTAGARDNLLIEHVLAGGVHLTGNTVIDALKLTVEKLKTVRSATFGHDILVTAHRRENFGAPLAAICDALLDLCRAYPDLRILYPVHPNPNVRGTVKRLLGEHARIELSDPLAYPALVAAMQQAKLILTDSGGIQEEAPALGKPVLVLRAVTERPEAVALGVAKIVGTDRAAIVAETRRLLEDSDHYARMASGGSPYGDGHAAERIVTVVRDYLTTDKHR